MKKRQGRGFLSVSSFLYYISSYHRDHNAHLSFDIQPLFPLYLLTYAIFSRVLSEKKRKLFRVTQGKWTHAERDSKAIRLFMA